MEGSAADIQVRRGEAVTAIGSFSFVPAERIVDGYRGLAPDRWFLFQSRTGNASVRITMPQGRLLINDFERITQYLSLLLVICVITLQQYTIEQKDKAP